MPVATLPVSLLDRRRLDMTDNPPFPIATSGALSQPRLREHVKQRLERALGRIGGRIQRVTTRCSDVNGPRGGVDQLCRVELALRGLPPIVVEKRAETARQAFDRAVNAAKRALRRTHERSGKSSARKLRRGAAAAAAPERGAAAAPDEGSLIGRRVGRSAERLERVAERPEKWRRDVWVDTARPGTSASDRKVGAGSTARRNTKLNQAGMTATLEDSAQDRPSRKSTRKSAGRAKRDTSLRLRATRKARAPGSRARKARPKGRGPKRR
jgi:ribosome-associated translation inhibitor RaiA